jgi:hypothetical protein
LVVSASAQDRPRSAPVPSDPVFVANKRDGSSISGRLQQVEVSGTIRLVGENNKELESPVAELVKLERERPDSPGAVVARIGPVLILPDGDFLHCESIGAAGERTLAVKVPQLAAEPLEFPLDALVAVLFAADSSASPVEFNTWCLRARTEARAGEVLWLKNGDRLEGGLAAITEKTLAFQSGEAAEPTEYPRAKIQGVGFNPNARPDEPGPDSWLELALVDGSRLAVVKARLDQGILHATTRYGPLIQVPLDQLQSLHFRSPRLVYLTEREPNGTAFVGYIDAHAERFGRDLTLTGSPLRVAGRRIHHGIATRPRTLLAYKTLPGDARFQAQVGVQEQAGPLASVVFRVLVDGQERFATKPMTVGEPSAAIDIDLKGVRSLVLATEFGERGDVQDEACWIEARILRD